MPSARWQWIKRGGIIYHQKRRAIPKRRESVNIVFWGVGGGDKPHRKISDPQEEDWRPERPMVQRASSDAPSVSGGHRESRMSLGIGYPSFQSAGYNKLFTQVNIRRVATLRCWHGRSRRVGIGEALPLPDWRRERNNESTANIERNLAKNITMKF